MFLLPSAPAGAPTPWSKIRFMFLLLPRNHFFRPQMQFFLKNICYFKKYIYLCTRKVLPWSGWEDEKTYWKRDLRPSVGPGSERRFLTLLVCVSNLATLKLETAVMQLRRLRVGDIYIHGTLVIPYYI